jgi:hypothetical protein
MQISKASFVRATEKISFFTGDEKFIALTAALMLFAKTALCVRRSSEHNAYFSSPFLQHLVQFSERDTICYESRWSSFMPQKKHLDQNTFCQFSVLFSTLGANFAA